MAYQIVEFDGVDLPVYNPTQDHSPAAGRSGLTDSVGGIYDVYGSRNSRTGIQTIPLTGLYFGQTEYVVDETGDPLVDETGDPVIAGDAENMLRAQLFTLAEKVTRRGRLERMRLDDGTRQWKLARFQQMNYVQVVTDRMYKAEVTCEFETAMRYWHADDATSYEINVTDGVTSTLLVENAGMLVEDAIVAVFCTSGTITAFRLTCNSLGIDWVWTGVLEDEDALTIDTGAQSVNTVTLDAYSGFSLAGHTAKGWLPLPRGSHLFYVTVLGGNATVDIEFYTQFP